MVLGAAALSGEAFDYLVAGGIYRSDAGGGV